MDMCWRHRTALPSSADVKLMIGLDDKRTKVTSMKNFSLILARWREADLLSVWESCYTPVLHWSLQFAGFLSAKSSIHIYQRSPEKCHILKYRRLNVPSIQHICFHACDICKINKTEYWYVCMVNSTSLFTKLLLTTHFQSFKCSAKRSF